MEREQSYEDIKRKLNLKEYKLHFFVPMTVKIYVYGLKRSQKET